MLLVDLFRALRQLEDRSAQRLVLYCVAGALALFVGLAIVSGAVLAVLDPTGIGWVDAVISIAGAGGALLLAWLLFPVTTVLILSLFLDRIAEAVERRHYPDLPPARGWGTPTAAWAAARLVALGLLLNLLALPLYLVPGANILIYLALNGYLLGREYFELVAQRRASRAEVLRMRRAARGRTFLAGVVIAAMLAVPVFNLVAPVVATAFMVHRFDRLRRRTSVGTGTAADTKAPREPRGGKV
ncbi:MAG TPA: EI24 domain-containing protein [Geminicoccaceae bacterium]|nr:EI24 domain-containing protein [Geminicoccaceae bacterium]